MKNLSIIASFLFLFASLTTITNAQYSTTVSETVEADIIEVALSDERFSTLATLLTEAELVPVLQNGENYTVFAPTNDAFAQLPQETVEALLADREMLREVLLTHVVIGEVLAAEVIEMDAAETVSGEKVSVKVSDYGVKIGDASVVQTDVRASNGVIHVIDSVIIPNKEHKDKDYNRNRSSYGSNY